MDPFSGEGELLNIQNAFYQGQYADVISFDISSLSAKNKITARVLQLRAQVASGEAKAALAAVRREGREADFAAVKAFANYTISQSADSVHEIEQLAAKEGNNVTVQVLGGTVLQAAGKTEEALSLLSKHEGSLEAVALIVQIHLQQNRTDLALKEVQAARKWAQDSLLVNVAESWVGLRMGAEKYQAGFYVFEEMAQAPALSSSSKTDGTKSLVSQAVAELHLGRLPEAEAALSEALERNPKDAEALANWIVWSMLSGNGSGKDKEKEKEKTNREWTLREVAVEHPMLVDLKEKSLLFDEAAQKYSPKVKASS